MDDDDSLGLRRNGGGDLRRIEIEGALLDIGDECFIGLVFFWERV
jgi:hypothetical protein